MENGHIGEGELADSVLQKRCFPGVGLQQDKLPVWPIERQGNTRVAGPGSHIHYTPLSRWGEPELYGRDRPRHKGAHKVRRALNSREVNRVSPLAEERPVSRELAAHRGRNLEALTD